ncbi:hypothetical protein RvVAR0630_43350 [Agrobacterium vitis]|nr:hypothetical protein RvVAR0630_43350 [Agrobacterium vitis]
MRSDQGSQFTSMDWASFLKHHNLVHSMSRRGDCHHNAVAESLFNLLKRERIRRKVYRSRDEARKDMFDYIEIFYNPKRKHVRNGMLSPVAFESSKKRNPGVSTKLRAIQKKELAGLLNGAEEPPAPLHPNLAKYYHEEIAALLDQLSNEETRAMVANKLRALVSRIDLVPNGKQLVIVLRGDLAAILTFASGKKKPNTSPC